MPFLIRRLGFVIVAAVAAIPAAVGQEDLLAQVYGRGVHEFNRGEMDCALRTFDMAINFGSRDPRVHYYRGLANLRLGCQDDAIEDFRTAATLEVDGAGTYDIGRALARIQGSDRLCLETVRLETKLVLSQRQPQRMPHDPMGMPGTLDPTLRDFGRDLPLDATDPFADEDQPPKLEVLKDPKPTGSGEEPKQPPAAPQDAGPFEGAPEAAPDAAGQSQPPAPADAAEAPATEEAPAPAGEDIFGGESAEGEDDNPFD